MALNAESLRKILELECQKGYLDSAVIGGLDKFLAGWAAQAVESITTPSLLNRFKKLNLTNDNYASLATGQRREFIDKILAFLLEFDGSGSAKTVVESAPAARRASSKPKTNTIQAGQSINSAITVNRGISVILATRFEKLGVRTVRDLLYFFPHRHLDYSRTKSISQLSDGKEETIVANLWQAREIRLGGRRSTEAIVGDETGNVRVVWFNNPYLAKTMKTNTRLVISGRVTLYKGQHVFESPEWELLGDRELVHTGRLVPVYPLTRGLYPRQVRKLMKEVVDGWANQLVDFLPSELVGRQKLLDLPQAISQAHFPEDEKAKVTARLRLAFDELLLLQLGVLRKKRDWQEGQPGNPLPVNQSLLETFLHSLPFTLTSAQDKALMELLADIEQSRPMSRLLQGDVGSGKTVVAAAALLMATVNGYQGALMAPTEILAEQHYFTICQLLSSAGSPDREEERLSTFAGLLPSPLTVALLTGDTKGAKKKALQERIASGEINIVIGTHALFQKEVEFNQLGLAVIDEQHRFGVEQRSALRQKGYNPHILVMTATPIPRTLALTLYGDLDLSVIDQLPPGRQEIKTKWLKPEQRASAYAFVRRQATEGHQSFIICPLVEESETIQARAAVAEFERLSEEVFPDLKLGLLHGRLSATDKNKVMRRFHAGELDIIVATPVVEVGVDVPNATVMIVDSADRFGLSQLHQFRGRVGRGEAQSYCMLLSQNPSEVARQRLDVIENTLDGFQLAEEDLKLRGPGEFFGTRQSGIPDLRMARISDVRLLELARREAIKLFKKDPNLEKPEHALLIKELARVWPEVGEWS